MRRRLRGLFPWGTDEHGKSPPGYMRPSEEGPRRVVVFVHGIFSKNGTFSAAQPRFAHHPAMAGTEYFFFDYDFWDSMEANGSRLASALTESRFADGDRLVVVGHSMGGLIARFAILDRPLPFVRLLVMLGTPNAGALRLSQLTALCQAFHGAVGVFSALLPRASGVQSLSEAARLIEERRASFSNADHIDYLTVPGLRFHGDRSVWSVPRDEKEALMTGVSAFVGAVIASKLERPHDGIVEESSNNLARSVRDNEKTESYGGARGTAPPTYAHLEIAPCREAHHLSVHCDPQILGIVAELVAAKLSDAPPDFRAWAEALPREVRHRLGVKFAPPLRP